ncbi:MAG: hypothetical protein H6840_12615 [Planctomycetes bacterium]|nr:hypothetical protein [Planctomycetota bacterium]
MAITPEQVTPGDHYKFLVVLGIRDLDGFYEGRAKSVAHHEGRTFLAFDDVHAIHYPGYATRTHGHPHGMAEDLMNSLIDARCIKAIARSSPPQ